MKNVIGLFGSCDKSTWREPVMKIYDQLGLEYFNPVVEDWDPSCTTIENEHLQEDRIILFPILAETAGLGSLGEIGFSCLNIFINNILGNDQTLIVMIDDESTIDDPIIKDVSYRMRALIKSKVLEIKHPNIYIVQDLDDMVDLSIEVVKNNIAKDNNKMFTT